MADSEVREGDAKEQEAPSTPYSPTAARKSPVPSHPGSAKSGSKAGSKPSSAKSGSPSRTRSASGQSPKPSAKSSARSPSPKANKAKGKGKKIRKDEDVETKMSETPGDLEEGLPEGVLPIFLASMTQEIFECRGDIDVTGSEPYKLIKKEDILKDLHTRAAVSDFHPVKQLIVDYPEDELLLGYDRDFAHGQNFFLATTVEAKLKLLQPDIDEEEEEVEEIVYKYVPPQPKDWVSLGSERDIEEESLKESRKRVKMSVKRMRRFYGEPTEFADRGETKDSCVECLPYEDKTFDLKRMELDKATQAIPEFLDTASQTDWRYPRNAATQYYPREFTEEKAQEVQKEEGFAKFLEEVIPRFELALQQNEIMDMFYDDWVNLADEDSSFGSKADNHLKEYQSFTDLAFSKDKSITCIDWHPVVRGVVGVAVGERMSFDDRIDHAARVIMSPSLILIWSFTDPIHPQLLLEAPDDILCFKFCPTDPNYLAGGCVNGQVVLWDISQHSERLKAPRGGKRKTLNTLPGFEDESSWETPVVRYCAVSSIEHSHRAPITDIQWVPDHLEVSRMGVPQENRSGQCVQIMTCAVDHTVLFWDLRPPKTHQPSHGKHKGEIKNPMGVPDTFKHLDLTWKPHLKIMLSKSEPGGDHSPVKFTIAESQGDKSSLQTDDEDRPEKKESEGFSFGNPKPSSAHKRTLKTVKTHFYVGTEDGEIVYLDWMPQKDQDSGKIQTPKPDFYHTLHDGPVTSVERSPFFKDIILCVGGWNFSIWKEGVTSGPILLSSPSGKRLTAGYWSPTRPAVFYISRQDGSVDIWDLLDRTHEPSMNQSVSPAIITCLYPYQVTNKQHLLAVGDNAGTLHILEIPWSLRQPTPNEMTGVANYFDREVKRRSFVVARWDFREKEKMELEAEHKRKAGIAPNVQLTDEEIEVRMKMEYQAYLDEEASFLRSLGLKEDVDEPLPQVD